MTPNEQTHEDVEIISEYTRDQAIEDGFLVDVSDMAREAGFKWPVAVTRRVWDEIVTPDPRAVQWGQSEKGRLWDVLYLARIAARGCAGRVMHYRLSVILKERQRRTIILKSVVGGETPDGGPCITIMLPDED